MRVVRVDVNGKAVTDESGNPITESTRSTRGKRRMPKKRFRGPGRGTKDYLNGENPIRLSNGGRIPQEMDE